jgi:hypothetical protein
MEDDLIKHWPVISVCLEQMDDDDQTLSFYLLGHIWILLCDGHQRGIGNIGVIMYFAIISTHSCYVQNL